jgi:hypothetical protein
MTEQVKVSWKVGNVELQYEGNEDYLKAEVPELFRELLEIYKSASKNGELEPPTLPAEMGKPAEETPTNTQDELSVNTIATRIGIKEKRDLAVASCLYLVLMKKKEPFARSDVLVVMKDATHYYNDNSRKGLSQYLESLVKDGILLERTKDVFAFRPEKLKEYQKILAN